MRLETIVRNKGKLAYNSLIYQTKFSNCRINNNCLRYHYSKALLQVSENSNNKDS